MTATWGEPWLHRSLKFTSLVKQFIHCVPGVPLHYSYPVRERMNHKLNLMYRVGNYGTEEEWVAGRMVGEMGAGNEFVIMSGMWTDELSSTRLCWFKMVNGDNFSISFLKTSVVKYSSVYLGTLNSPLYGSCNVSCIATYKYTSLETTPFPAR